MRRTPIQQADWVDSAELLALLHCLPSHLPRIRRVLFGLYGCWFQSGPSAVGCPDCLLHEGTHLEPRRKCRSCEKGKFAPELFDDYGRRSLLLDFVESVITLLDHQPFLYNYVTLILTNKQCRTFVSSAILPTGVRTHGFAEGQQDARSSRLHHERHCRRRR